MNTSTISSKQPRSAYQQSTFEKQSHAHKTAGNMLFKGIGLIGSSILLALLAAVIAGFMKQQGNIMVGAVGLFALGLFLTGIVMTLQSIFGKKHQVSCPYCGKKYNLFDSTKSYICDHCGHVLQTLGAEQELIQIACPICNNAWAVTPNRGSVRCFNCGSRGTVQNGKAAFNIHIVSCSSCGTSNPDGLYFCWKCGSMIGVPEPVKDPESDVATGSISVESNCDGMDFITMRAVSPVGLLINAVGRLNNVISAANQLAEPNYQSLTLAIQIQHSLEDMEEALLQCPEYSAQIRSILPSITPILARTLVGIKVGSMAYGDTELYNGFWSRLSSQYNLLVKKVNPQVNLTLEKIGWPSHLVRVERGSTVGMSNPPQFTTIVNNDSDIKEWCKCYLSEGMVHPLSLPGILNLEDKALLN